MIKGLSHVAINTSNLERSLKFYHETLGFPIVEDLTLENGFRLVHLQVGPDSTIELFGRVEPVAPLPQGQHVGIVHLALAVDDVDGMCLALQAKGVVFTGPPREGRGLTKRLVFFQDPDGVTIELVKRERPAHV